MNTPSNEKIFSRFLDVAQRLPEKVALLTDKSQMSFGDIVRLVQVIDVQLSQYNLQDGETIALSTKRAEFVFAFIILASFRNLTLVFATASDLKRGGLKVNRLVGTKEADGFEKAKQIIIDADWFQMMGSLPSGDWGKHKDGQCGFVLNTSGTTGKPKFIYLSEQALLQDMSATQWESDKDLEAQRHISTSQNTAGISIRFNLRVLLAGGSVIATDQSMNAAFQLADLWRASHMTTTPGAMQAALKLNRPEQFFTGLKSIVLMGASAPADLLDRITAMTSARIAISYGSTETGPLTQYPYDPLALAAEGYLGKACRTDIDFIFESAGDEVDPDLPEGELIIHFRTANERRYLGHSEEETEFQSTHFRSGDLVRRSDDELYFLGRKKNILNQGGNKYSLEAIELFLNEAFSGSEFVALPVLQEQGSEELCVVHTGPGDLKAETVQVCLSQKWTGLKLARLVRLDEIPLSANGKVDRIKLQSDLN